jgi:hypothetical protein
LLIKTALSGDLRSFSHTLICFTVTLLIIMAINNKSKRRSENLGRRKKTVLKKIYELGKYDGIDVALIIRQNGRFFTYRSIDHESWPPSMKEIVRLYHLDLHIHTNVKAASFIPYPQEHASSRYRKRASESYRSEFQVHHR